ncbi:MAG: DUF2213 domain-containing protein [Bradymonadaceae bacterium]
MEFDGFRFDSWDLKPSHERPDGALVCEAIVARPGILEYKLDDGSVRRELVTAETLTRPQDLETLGFAYVTDEHPPEPVNPHNAKQYSVGSVGEVVDGVKPDGLVKVRLVLQDEDAIEGARSGERNEDSPGYKVKTREDSGVHDEFGEYDAIQVARQYNHLAICEESRAGSDVRLRADGAAGETGGIWSFRCDSVDSVGLQKSANAVHVESGDAPEDDDQTEVESRVDGHKNLSLRDAFNLGLDIAEQKSDLTEAGVAEQIAASTEESKASALMTLRGDFEPNDQFLQAFADVTGFPIEVLQQAKTAGMEHEDSAGADPDPEPADEPEGENEDAEPETDNSHTHDDSNERTDGMDPVEAFNQAISELEDRIDSLKERADEEDIEISGELQQLKSQLSELKTQRDKIDEEISNKTGQLKAVLKEIDPSLLNADPDEEQPDADGTTEGDNSESPRTNSEGDGGDDNLDSKGGSTMFESEEDAIEYMNKRDELLDLAERYNVDGAGEMKLDALRREILKSRHDEDEVERMDSSEVQGAIKMMKHLDSERQKQEGYDQLSNEANDRRDAGGTDDKKQRLDDARSDYANDLYGDGDDEAAAE